MASIATLSLVAPALLPIGATAAAYSIYRAVQVDWGTWLTYFVTGPGRTSRILLLVFVALSWKSIPLAWTARVIHALVYHAYLFPRKSLAPCTLFHYAVTRSHGGLLETDYNLHKSNSTYFADLDVSRSHLVTHLLGPTMPRVAAAARAGKITDRRTGQPLRGAGALGVMLGAVFCSFRREVAPLQAYEMWSRVLAWDRKWLYIVTHFVEHGRVRPTLWDGRRGGPTRQRVPRAAAGDDGQKKAEPDWTKYVIATAVSKYVFKLGRLTLHPAIALDEAGLLPQRPGEGWLGGESETTTLDDLGVLDEGSEWDWRRVEHERRKGMAFADHFAELDGTNSLFDGGEDGALGRFPLG